MIIMPFVWDGRDQGVGSGLLQLLWRIEKDAKYKSVLRPAKRIDLSS
jgi:hypothetical protein